MSWPGLLKARDNVRNVSRELDRMLKEANGFGKKDIANHKETLLAEIDRSAEEISLQIADLRRNLGSHRKYVEAKSVFLRRHYKRH